MLFNMKMQLLEEEGYGPAQTQSLTTGSVKIRTQMHVGSWINAGLRKEPSQDTLFSFVKPQSPQQTIQLPLLNQNSIPRNWHEFPQSLKTENSTM